MRITLSLALLVGLTTVSAAQHSKVQPSQASPQKAEKAVTVTRSANTPQADANCAPGTLTVITNLPSSGGGGSPPRTFTPDRTRRGPPPPSKVRWVAPPHPPHTLSPNPDARNTAFPRPPPSHSAAPTR